ncbi:MAG: glutamate-5-semialdehyde dehydrogenase [Alphaproteobacteria bacterium]|nr:glutamate-5-semialdehyde dehydrogenase [Alphaproteobacteria bacterium]
MNEDVTAQLTKTKDAAHDVAALTDAARAAVLDTLADELELDAAHILAENAKDLAEMPKEDPRFDRLLLNEERLKAIAADVRKVARLPAPTGRVLEDRQLENGLHLQRIAVPLGVIGVIYESRPNVTVDVFTLCFKSGNAVALKGGKEARHSNAVLAAAIARSLKKHHVSADACYLLPPDRAAAQVMMHAVGLVDVCIPRGSQALIDAVRAEAKVPVIETGAGIVHTYVDKSADIDKARDIIFNAKTRRVSVCNALDTLLLHQDLLEYLPRLTEKLAEKDVEIFADAQSHEKLSGHYPEKLLHKAAPEDFGREFLSYKMSIRTVPSLAEALSHIRRYSSRHSEAIVAQDEAAIEQFLQSVDAAAVYANASTAFTDGGQFGLGAEIGISTQKLHARGPMALEALTSYKWIIRGAGQVRA